MQKARRKLGSNITTFMSLLEESQCYGLLLSLDCLFHLILTSTNWLFSVPGNEQFLFLTELVFLRCNKAC